MDNFRLEIRLGGSYDEPKVNIKYNTSVQDSNSKNFEFKPSHFQMLFSKFTQKYLLVPSCFTFYSGTMAQHYIITIHDELSPFQTLVYFCHYGQSPYNLLYLFRNT